MLQYLKLEKCDQRMFGDPKEVECSIYEHQRDRSEASETEMQLYTALLVYRLCRNGMTSIYDSAKIFKVSVGWIQQTYESMCHRAQALGRFSEVIYPLLKFL